jgi:hypothetical protein
MPAAQSVPEKVDTTVKQVEVAAEKTVDRMVGQDGACIC